MSALRAGSAQPRGEPAGRSWDVIVVGAGPAGAAATLDFRLGGARVLLLERRSFPRVKPCAGALTTKAVRRLRFPIDKVARERTDKVEIRVRGQPSHRIDAPGVMATLTGRRELDALCLRRAQEAGAELLTDGLAGLDEGPRGLEVTCTDGRRLAARFVIGADGAASRTRRLLSRPPPTRALAIEGSACLEASSGFGGLLFDTGAIPRGYGWAFSKGDHVNVGLYAADPRASFAKAELVTYARKAFGVERLESVVGHALGASGSAACLGAGRVLLAGDAAGTAEVLLGEGIHNAVASGQAAAWAVLQALGQAGEAAALYRRRMAPLLADIRMSARLARPFYAFPRAGCALMRSPPISRRLARGYAAGRTLDAIVRGGRADAMGFRSAAAAARLA